MGQSLDNVDVGDQSPRIAKSSWVCGIANLRKPSSRDPSVIWSLLVPISSSPSSPAYIFGNSST